MFLRTSADLETTEDSSVHMMAGLPLCPIEVVSVAEMDD